MCTSVHRHRGPLSQSIQYLSTLVYSKALVPILSLGFFQVLYSSHRQYHTDESCIALELSNTDGGSYTALKTPKEGRVLCFRID